MVHQGADDDGREAPDGPAGVHDQVVSRGPDFSRVELADYRPVAAKHPVGEEAGQGSGRETDPLQAADDKLSSG